MDTQLIVWIILAAVFAMLELATLAFVSLYLSAGAIAAAIGAALGLGITGQLLLFVGVGIVLMAMTRPVLKRRLESPDVPMNVSRIVGKGAIVTIPIDNDQNTGQIRVGTEYWTARRDSAHPGEPIPADAHVNIVSVEGVTALVVPRDA